MDLDELGRKLFKNPTRLLTGAWVFSRKERFFQAEAADGVNELADGTTTITTSEVTKALNLFIDLGMVVVLHKQKGDRRLYYERVDSPGWDVIEACIKAAPKL